MQRADLHTHTRFSDGAHSPRELVAKARRAELTLISITDHDNVDGIPEALAAGEELGVEVVPGVELSAHVEGREIHILGYFIDVGGPALNEFLAFLREERVNRAERMVEKLRAINIPIEMGKVLGDAGVGSVGRPHIANAVIEEGFAESQREVFAKYIGYGRPAYVEKFRCEPGEAFSAISQAGGLSFLAHPGTSFPEGALLRLIKDGLDGIEVVHPSHSPETVNLYRSITSEYYLLESGGSDFHGGRKNDDAALGRYTIPLSTVDTMRRRLFGRQK